MPNRAQPSINVALAQQSGRRPLRKNGGGAPDTAAACLTARSWNGAEAGSSPERAYEAGSGPKACRSAPAVLRQAAPAIDEPPTAIGLHVADAFRRKGTRARHTVLHAAGAIAPDDAAVIGLELPETGRRCDAQVLRRRVARDLWAVGLAIIAILNRAADRVKRGAQH